MLHRIKQFLRSLVARISPAERELVNSILTPAEQQYFYNMNVFDQAHCLRVYHTACSDSRIAILDHKEMQLLAKACLLHDIARTKQDICLIDKVLAVLLDKWHLLKPTTLLEKFSKLSPRNFSKRRYYAQYIYYFHPTLSAMHIYKLGQEDVAKIIYYHHHNIDKLTHNPHKQPSYNDDLLAKMGYALSFTPLSSSEITILKILQQADNAN